MPWVVGENPETNGMYLVMIMSTTGTFMQIDEWDLHEWESLNVVGWVDVPSVSVCCLTDEDHSKYQIRPKCDTHCLCYFDNNPPCIGFWDAHNALWASVWSDQIVNWVDLEEVRKMIESRDPYGDNDSKSTWEICDER